MKANDNDMSDAQRIKALERSISILRRDLKDADIGLRRAPDDPRLKKQKGANEKLIFLALAELSKVRKKVDKRGVRLT